jgi:hypothetical protein
MEVLKSGVSRMEPKAVMCTVCYSILKISEKDLGLIEVSGGIFSTPKRAVGTACPVCHRPILVPVDSDTEKKIRWDVESAEYRACMV